MADRLSLGRHWIRRRHSPLRRNSQQGNPLTIILIPSVGRLGRRRSRRSWITLVAFRGPVDQAVIDG
jgi:hypothetical protein